jgi:hypothetical protein
MEAGVCRKPVRGMRRMSWPFLGENFKKIDMWYITKFLNEGSNLREVNKKTT